MTSAPTSDAPTVTITAGELSGAHIDMEVRVSLPDGGVLSGQLVGVGHTSDHSLAVGQPRCRRPSWSPRPRLGRCGSTSMQRTITCTACRRRTSSGPTR
jgi:hypothetical protein